MCAGDGISRGPAEPDREDGRADGQLRGRSKAHTDTAFKLSKPESTAADPFTVLPPELIMMILLKLERGDVANLRLASRSYQQLPQEYFRHLLRLEMPWIWEANARAPGTINWHLLWCALSAADGGSSADERMRDWLSMAEHTRGDWDLLVAGLSDAEAEEHPLRSMESKSDYPSREEEAAMNGIAKDRKAAGKQWPKPTQIHGLRNRRRIYKDILEILARIEALYTDSDSEGGVTEDSVTEGGVTEDSVTEDGVTEDTVTEDNVTEDSVTEDNDVVSP